MRKPQSTPPETRRAYRVNDFCALYGLGRSSVYALMAKGKLRTVRIGGRRLIPADEAEALLRVETE
jgi:excisionase family DNA binding protein